MKMWVFFLMGTETYKQGRWAVRTESERERERERERENLNQAPHSVQIPTWGLIPSP